MRIIDDFEQGTPEWFQARRGRITASSRASVIANKNLKSWSTLRDSIDYDLSPFWEHKEFTNDAMDWGREHEAEAIANVSLAYGVEAIEPGLVIHPQHYYAGATPDFFLGSKVSGQVKCPYRSDNHRKVLITQKIPDQYYHQVNFEAWVSGRPKILFVSYDPRAHESEQCAFIETEANTTLWAVFEENLLAFRRMFEDNVAPVKQLPPAGIPTLF
jgi:putative phage-type endonuclease